MSEFLKLFFRVVRRGRIFRFVDEYKLKVSIVWVRVRVRVIVVFF